MAELKILYLEDSALDAELAATVLDGLGTPFRLRVVDNREKFLAALADESFDVVLLDYNLPGFSGSAAMEWMHERYPQVPVIVVSGAIGEESAIETMIGGATDYVLKNRLSRLVPAVQRALREADEQARRRRAEAALAESEARYRRLLENIEDLVCEVDGAGTFLFVTRSCFLSLGYQPEELLGRSFVEFIHPDDHTPALERWQRMIEACAPANGEWRFRRRDGSWRWFDCVGQTFQSADDSIRAVVIARDVTDRKEGEEKLQAALAEKVALLQEVHHRVKNNLAILIGLLSLQMEYSAEPGVIRAFQQYQQRIRSMALAHEALYRSKNLSRVACPDYLRELLRHLAATDPAMMKVDVDLQVEPVELKIEKAIPVGLIVTELVCNSAHFAFPGGAGGAIRIALLRQGGEWELQVDDNGVGLPPETDPADPATLGLKLVGLMVQQLHGVMEFHRRGGTSFRLRFQAD